MQTIVPGSAYPGIRVQGSSYPGSGTVTGTWYPGMHPTNNGLLLVLLLILILLLLPVMVPLEVGLPDSVWLLV